MFERKLLRDFDWSLLLLALLLTLCGLVLIHSATGGADRWLYVRKQVLWLGFGVVGLGLLAYLDYGRLARWHAPIYGVTLLLLLTVACLGHTAMGATRWLNLGGFRLQPSEFAKLGLIVTLAALFARRLDQRSHPSTLLRSVGHFGAPVLLVFFQPDLGTALVLLALWLGMSLAAGVRGAHLAAVMGVIVVLCAGVWQTGLIKPYQRARLASFINPNADPLGAGYHINQSRIAIGSGGLFGSGLLRGHQGRLHYIPEQRTDFIFTVVGEEAGFIGSVGLLGIYLLLVLRLLKIALRAKDELGLIMGAGVATMIAFQVLVNVGMTLGVMPITGIPLPFLSYGGSSLLTSFMALGLVLSISMRQRKIIF